MKKIPLWVAVLLPALLFSQSPAVQVGAYLGHRVNNAPPSGTEVSYSFEFREFTRTADGKKDYVALLTGGAFYSASSNVGNLTGIYMNGTKVAPSDGYIHAKAVKAASIPTAGGASYSLPDSAQTARQIEALKAKCDKREFMFFSFMWWDYLSWYVHRNIYPVLLVIYGMVSFFSWGASTEFAISAFGGTVFGSAFKQIHSACSFISYLISGLFVGILIADVLIMLILSGWAWWAVFIVAIGLTFAAGKIHGYIIPNPKVIRSGGGGGWDHPNNRLPG